MRYLVFGAGAIGSTIGGHMFRAGHEVILIGRHQHVNAIKNSGLKLITGEELFNLQIPAVTSIDQIAPIKREDVILLTVKTQHTAQSISQLQLYFNNFELPIICCQNSIWNEPYAHRILERVYGAVIYVAATYLTAGEVVNPRTGDFGYIEIGNYPKGQDEFCKTVVKDLQKASFAAIATSSIMHVKGAKLLGNLGNAVSAITGTSDGSKEFLIKTREEAIDVLSLAGIPFESLAVFDQRRRKTYKGTNIWPQKHAGSPARGGSSWQSLARGTGNIESEFLNGEIVKLGRMLGIKTPYNEILWHHAQQMADNMTQPGYYNVDHLHKEVELLSQKK